MKTFHNVRPDKIIGENLMESGPVGDLKRDVIYSLAYSVVGFSLLFWVEFPLKVLENIGSFNATITTILGLLFTVLAVIYTFSSIGDNRAIKELKRVGKFGDVVDVFTLSIAVIGGVWIYTFTLTVFDIHRLFSRQVRFAFAYFAVIGFFFTIQRLWRCFQIFFLLNKAIKDNQ